jgi:hypothetical protein
MKFAHHDRASGSRTRKSARPASVRLSCGEALEDRWLLASDLLASSLDALWSTADSAPIAVPMTSDVFAEPMVGTALPNGFTPTQLRHAYGFDQIVFDGGTIVGDGTGQTIAIVNAYHTPNAASDLAAFSAAFGLAAPPSFIQVDQNGGTNYPGSSANWALETALDVQWAHAFAPGANILLVEANSGSFNDLTAAVDFARNYTGVSVVSMSWGAAEWSGESFYNSYFTTPVGHDGVTFFAAAGNSGGPGVYPAYSPNVTAVGGTTLTLNGSNNIISETAWSGSGGGVSQYQAKPSWQNGVANQSATHRVMPDVAFDANPNTGVPVYDTFNNLPSAPWTKAGGTSFATPAWAALVTIANQGRTLAGLPVFDTASLMTRIYSMASTNFNDITSGTSGGSIPQSAGVGFDAITGRGSPKAALVAASLVNASTAPLAVMLVAASDTGSSSADNLTRLNNSSGGTTLQFQISGTIAGSTVNLYAGNTLIGTAFAAGTTTVVTTNGSFTLVDGLHSITARQVEPGKGLSAATPALSITIDATAPTASIVAVNPDPRTTPVSSFSLQFSEVVSGLNVSALSLTLNGGASLLTGAQSVSTLDGVTWSLNSTSGITALSGLYELILTSALSPVTDAAGNVSGNALESFTVTASVLGRMLFYNQSTFDGNNPSITAGDDGAIATDKSAYLPGSGIATFANLSSYSRGINGLMIDVTGSHPGITASDFTFRVGNNNSPQTWAAAPAPLAVSVRAGAGTGGGDRIVITWANGAIKNEWLEVILLATENSGLASADVFFFGNKVADSGTATPAGQFATSTADSLQLFSFLGAGKPITDIRDYNRDGQVTTTDSLLVFANLGSIVRLNVAAGGPFAPEAIAAAVVATGNEDEMTAPQVISETSVLTSPAAAPLTVATPALPPEPPSQFDRSLAFATAYASQRGMGDESHAGVAGELDNELLDLLLGSRSRRAALRR